MISHCLHTKRSSGSSFVTGTGCMVLVHLGHLNSERDRVKPQSINTPNGRSAPTNQAPDSLTAAIIPKGMLANIAKKMIHVWRSTRSLPFFHFSCFILCLTSKMSETDAWRGACVSPALRDDKYPASLHRIISDGRSPRGRGKAGANYGDAKPRCW